MFAQREENSGGDLALLPACSWGTFELGQAGQCLIQLSFENPEVILLLSAAVSLTSPRYAKPNFTHSKYTNTLNLLAAA